MPNCGEAKETEAKNSGGKENNSHSASLEAQVATLTSLVAELVKSNK
jgi:hypothetical protein